MQGRKLVHAGLEKNQSLAARFDFAFPAVDGLGGGNECGACGQPLLDQGSAQVVRLIGIGGGGQNHAGGRAGFSHGALPL